MIHLSRWKVILLVLSLLFGLLFSYPNLLTTDQREALPGWLPKSGLNLGLDLQGGSYLLLEVDGPAMREKRLANLANHHAGCDHIAPTRPLRVIRVREQRIVITAAIGPVTDRVMANRLDILRHFAWLFKADKLLLTFNIFITNFVGNGLLPLFALLNIICLRGHSSSPKLIV
jgi:hypothetical protein